MTDRKTIEAALVATGWTKDRWGHYKSASGDGRVKMQATSFRVERKHTYAALEFLPASTEWINVVSDYYKNASILPDGRVAIKGRALKVQG